MSINNIKFIPSPNFDPANYRAKIDRIIIHSTEGSYDSAIDWLCRPNGNSSCHYIISEDGSDITQIVKDESVAWHAGNYGYNQRAIGIENAGFASKGFQYKQVVTCAKLTAYLADKYKIPVDFEHIIPHSAVPYPNDHTDPGGKWPWQEFINLVLIELNGPDSVPTKPYQTDLTYTAEVIAPVIVVRAGPGTANNVVTKKTGQAGLKYNVIGESHGELIRNDDVWSYIPDLGGFVTRTVLRPLPVTAGGHL